MININDVMVYIYIYIHLKKCFFELSSVCTIGICIKFV